MQKHLDNLKRIADLMDNQFNFLGFRFGLDPILGLFPWVGDLIGAATSAYIIWVATQLKIPKSAIRQMYINLFADLLIGAIPGVGDIADFFFKANTKNYAILKKHLPAEFVEGKITT